MNYTKLNEYLTSVRTEIYANQNLCKLLYYDYDDPLAQATITDTSILYTDKNNQKLFFAPFTVDSDDVRISKLFVNINKVSLDNYSEFFNKIDIDFIIACNNYLWEIDDNSGDIKTRPIMMWEEINTIMNKKHTGGIGTDLFVNSKLIYFNDYFTGYQIVYNGLGMPTL